MNIKGFFSSLLILLLTSFIIMGCGVIQTPTPPLPVPDLWPEPTQSEIKIRGHEDDVIDPVCLRVTEIYSQFDDKDLALNKLTTNILAEMGILASSDVADCGSRLSIMIEGNSIKGDYNKLGVCYLGYYVEGSMKFSIHDNSVSEEMITYSESPPSTIIIFNDQIHCPSEPVFGEIGFYSQASLLNLLYKVWGFSIVTQALNLNDIDPEIIAMSLSKEDKNEVLRYIMYNLIDKNLSVNLDVLQVLVELKRIDDSDYFDKWMNDFSEEELQKFATILLYASRLPEDDDESYYYRSDILYFLRDISHNSPESILVPYVMETWRIVAPTEKQSLMEYLIINAQASEEVVDLYVPEFIKATKDPNEIIRNKAFEVLRMITKENIGNKTSDWQDWYENKN